MVTCGRSLPEGSDVVLLAHDAAKGEAYWDKGSYGKRLHNGLLLTNTSNLIGKLHCGWQNHFCKAYCKDCSQLNGVLW